MEIVIKHDPSLHKFYFVKDNKEGFLEYSQPDKHTLNYHHTYVPPELRGQQLGEKIVKFALDYAEKNNYKIIPTCPFVKQFIEKHSEYQFLKRV